MESQLTQIASLTQSLAALLIENEYQLATAESCTGGWIAKSCTDLAGSSMWFERGFVTYSNQAKIEQLAVSNLTLEQYGAVSQQTAEQMALGALNHSTANISVSVTGIAGPTGGSVEKPVGTVWVAWADKNTVSSAQYHFLGDREAVRIQTVIAALQGLIKNARA
jgi:nicotinamide-nucleotide amidase